MQAMPDARQQSFEEIYGPPENFLEIEVSAKCDFSHVSGSNFKPLDLDR